MWSLGHQGVGSPILDQYFVVRHDSDIEPISLIVFGARDLPFMVVASCRCNWVILVNARAVALHGFYWEPSCCQCFLFTLLRDWQWGMGPWRLCKSSTAILASCKQNSCLCFIVWIACMLCRWLESSEQWKPPRAQKCPTHLNVSFGAYEWPSIKPC